MPLLSRKNHKNLCQKCLKEETSRVLIIVALIIAVALFHAWFSTGP